MSARDAFLCKAPPGEDAALESSGVDHLANNASEITDNGNAAFVFHAGGPDDSEETRRTVIGRVRASDQRKVPHVWNTEFRTDADLYTLRRAVRDALIQNFDQAAFLFEHLE